jgi:hypothetical protein
MEKCLSCGQAAEFSFQALEIRTLHIRDLEGEKRVQALGECKEFHVCRNCAQAQLDKLIGAKKTMGSQTIIYSLIFLLGIFLSINFWTSNGAFRLLGLAALVCGVLGNISVYKKNNADRESYSHLTQEQQLAKAAWECVEAHAPSKDDINDLTYIPVTPETLELKNGDLMILYKLLPEIAVEAYKYIHLRK